MKTNRFGKRWKAIVVLLVFALLLVFAGCGRKAPPEPPESGSPPVAKSPVVDVLRMYSH